MRTLPSTVSRRFRKTGILSIVSVVAATNTVCLTGRGEARADTHPPTLEDVIRLNRIQYHVANDDTIAAFSPDGTKIATVVWHGDLSRNANIYSILIFDLRGEPGNSLPRVLLSREFTGDPNDQEGSPFSRLVFSNDGTKLIYLGRSGTDAAQVYSIDLTSGQVTRLSDHPSAVRTFSVDARGQLVAFSAVSTPEAEERSKKLDGDGVFLWDQSMFPARGRYMDIMSVLETAGPKKRQYFLTTNTESRRIFDSRQSHWAKPLDESRNAMNAPTLTLEDDQALRRHWGTLTASPDGKNILMFPYALEDYDMHAEAYAYYGPLSAYLKRVAAPYGLLDVDTGKITRLVDAPHPQMNPRGYPLWANDGRSVIVYSLLPDRRDAPPEWVEVELSTHQTRTLGIPSGWQVICWNRDQNALVLNKGSSFALLPMTSGAKKGELSQIGSIDGMSSTYPFATNGVYVVWVKEGLSSPPELMATRLIDNITTRLSNLNPDCQAYEYGETALFTWSNRYENNASGFLIKPLGYTKNTRYPLIVLMDVWGNNKDPFLLDSAVQTHGYPIQTLAANGFVVLYANEPHMGDASETMDEAERVGVHIESAIKHLVDLGLVDETAVGIAGMSRAAYYVDRLLMRSPTMFKAAIQIDGGAREYNDGVRLFTDVELALIQTPLLFEAHRPTTLLGYSPMIDKMRAMSKPTDVLYFASGPHGLSRPQHRMRSMEVQLDWWRFWLQSRQDSNPAKAEQYRQWSKLRLGQN